MTRQDLQRLARARVVTTDDLSGFFHVSHRHAAKLAFDLRKRGFLNQVTRGVYASVPLDSDPKGFRPDSFLAVHRALGRGYAFSHWSALALLGGEQTVRKTVHVSAPGVRARRRNVGDFVVHVHTVQKDVWKNTTTRVRRGGKTLQVTSPAQTLVDLASLPNPLQDYGEDVEAFRTLLPRTDPKKLLRAVSNTRSVTTVARLGHLLSITKVTAPPLAQVLDYIRNRVAHAGPSYFATRPRNPSNRYDPQFKVVYPDGS